MGGFSIKNESLTGSVRRSRGFRAHVRRSRARRRYGLRRGARCDGCMQRLAGKRAFHLKKRKPLRLHCRIRLRTV